jgi:hypothetical protein
MKKSIRIGMVAMLGILCILSLSATYALAGGGGKSSQNRHKGWENRWKGWEAHWGLEGPPGGNPHETEDPLPEEEPPADEEEETPAEEEEETPAEEEEEAPAEEEEEAPAEEEEVY